MPSVRKSPKDLQPAERTIEDIIREGVDWQNKYDEAASYLKKLKEEAKPFFSRKTTKEAIKSAYGAVELTIANSWGLKDAFIEKLQTIFGNKSKLYIEEKITYKPTSTYKSLCKNEDILKDEYGKNGELILEAAKIDQRESIKFVAV